MKKLMTVVESYPPNYEFIKQHLNPSKDMIYCYGDTIYIPHKQEGDIPPDIEYHEYVHSQRQKEYTSPELWWTKYCLDEQFRIDEELEAYGAQYAFVKKHTPAKYAEHLLDEFADNLSSLYNIGMSHNVARSKIRNKAKNSNI